MLRRILLFTLTLKSMIAAEPSWADLLIRGRELQASGAHTDAEKTYLAAAEEAQRVQHRTGLARIWRDLAGLYQERGMLSQAEALLLQAISGLKGLTPPPAMEIANLNHSLAVGFRLQERFLEAAKLHRDVLRVREQTLGPDHGEVGASLHALAMVHVDVGQLQGAESLLIRATNVVEKFYGPASPNLANCLQALATVHAQLGDTRTARREIYRALSIQKNANGSTHISVGMTLNEVGRVEYSSQRYREAAAAWQQALAIFRRWWGPKHRLTALATMHLGAGKRMENRFEEAEELLAGAIRLFEEVGDKSLLATSLCQLALVHAYQGKHSQAEPLFRGSLAIANTTLGLGSDSPRGGICAMGLARSLLALGRAEEADTLHRSGLAIAERTFGLTHPELPLHLEFQASILRKLKRKSEAMEFEKRARSLRDRQTVSDWSHMTVDASELKPRSNK